MANKVTPVDYDFTTIKTSLQTYLENQTEFADYKFDGSAMSTFLDVLAYNTHYNAMTVNFGLNESFLDSARIRSSVVSSAKALGYTPKSVTSAVATITAQITGVTGSPGPLSMPAGTKFTTSIDGLNRVFNTTAAHTSDAAYKFTDILVTEGEIKGRTFIVDGADANQLFVIDDANIDTSTLKVVVKDSYSAASGITYSKTSDIINIEATSNVYFLQEGYDGNYEMYFGDGNVGRKLSAGQVIIVSYLSSVATDGNGANAWELSGTISPGTGATVTNVLSAAGGSVREGIESIRFNAPLAYSAQDRTVTASDYKTAIITNYSALDAISVWGGEDNVPPVYGKVFISIKPTGAEALTLTQKNAISTDILKPRAVMSITPVFTDPTYTYINLDVIVKYDPTSTGLSTDGVAALVRNKILTGTSSFSSTYLNKFNGIMRHSKLLSTIDSANVSLLSSIARVQMERRLVPYSLSKYIIDFPEAIFQKASVVLSSSEFVYSGQTCVLEDVVPTNGIGVRDINIVRKSGTSTLIVQSNIGTLDPATGIVQLNNFAPDAYTGAYIAIRTIPNSYDIAPERYMLLSMESSGVTITVQSDSSTVDYNANSRF
tara:strand:+ start:543 stop:2351 length:1809 start_codon:yes stop_codon:yes gene_type:complete